MIKNKDELHLFGIIPNMMITDNNISDNALAVYAVLRTVCFNTTESCAKFCISELLELLSVDAAQSKLIKPVTDGIVHLINNEYIELFDVFGNEVEFSFKNKSSYQVSFLLEDGSNCIDCEGGMTMVPKENLLALLKYIAANKGLKKLKLIRFYLLIARGCSNSSQMWKLSQRYFNKTIGIAKSTVADWKEILQDLGIIFYSNTNCDAGESNSRNYATVYFHARNGRA